MKKPVIHKSKTVTGETTIAAGTEIIFLDGSVSDTYDVTLPAAKKGRKLFIIAKQDIDTVTLYGNFQGGSTQSSMGAFQSLELLGADGSEWYYQSSTYWGGE